jgi:hypothetical protein
MSPWMTGVEAAVWSPRRLLNLLQLALAPHQLLRNLVAALALAILRVLAASVCSACLSSASISCFNRCLVFPICA